MIYNSQPCSDAIPALGNPNENIADITKRAPPTAADFRNFFATEPQKSRMDRLCFWSGTGEGAARDFATSKGRYTLEMLVGDKWKEYQNWNTWAESVEKFWNPISQACADAAHGEVFVYLTPQTDVDQQQDDPTRGNCKSCWYQKEKPILVSHLGSKVAQITKYLTTNQRTDAGLITSMGSKVKKI